MRNIEKIIEEFIEGHKKGMTSPERYWFFNSYFSNGKENYERGWFLIDQKIIDEKMKIVGKISDYNYIDSNDKNNESNNNVAEGFLSVKDNLMTMELLKIPLNSAFGFYYKLEKSKNKNNNIVGCYKGILYQLPNKKKIIGKATAIIKSPFIKR